MADYGASSWPRVSDVHVWAFVVRWSRVALALAVLFMSWALIRADHKVAQLEREATGRPPGAVVVDTLDRLDHRVADLEAWAATPPPTTTTSTTRRGTSHRPPLTTPSTRVTTSTTGTTAPRSTDPPKPKPCAVVVPFVHSCVNAP